MVMTLTIRLPRKHSTQSLLCNTSGFHISKMGSTCHMGPKLPANTAPGRKLPMNTLLPLLSSGRPDGRCENKTCVEEDTGGHGRQEKGAQSYVCAMGEAATAVHQGGMPILSWLGSEAVEGTGGV